MPAVKRLRASTKEWCERNSKPKSLNLTPVARPEPTRWQRPGPMGRNEWANFHSSYQKNVELHKALRLLGGKQKEARKEKVKKLTTEEVKTLRENQDRLTIPKWQRKKHIHPPPKQFPYRPQLSGRKKPSPEPGRPVKKPFVPCCFQHEDLETDFWAKIRFPISRRALTATPSRKICELAEPRQFPPKTHCSWPNSYENHKPKSQKMSPRQWRIHLQRLEFLSKPKPRILPPRMVCCCRRDHQD
ncbi:uncharacterized protein LOC108117211 [Drosophila eugracilis]|uniref:uncharacterized protein LOC108117211 n=1 Tax=Drosophila eugracilis TaxID=29029 RepID=UPI001BD9B898|nr:uncharacterized protein LOC108117211 [Drosophila eugracilis]